jgi:teichuronic acid biosynthesis glycosyltransferase TuaG
MYKKYIKRPIDIIGATLILIVFLPVAIITSLVIRITCGAPVIFRQLRTGRHGEDFTMYKYRTMHHKNNVHDTASENQMTTVGMYVRALSLDEIPQLINVIKGDMSFIGPRPWIPNYYQHMTQDQRKRASVRPGITGLAQARGRNSLTVFDKLNYDLLYIKKITFTNDCKIVILTLKEMFKRASSTIDKLEIHNEINLLKRQHIDQRQLTAEDFYAKLPEAGSTLRIKRNIEKKMNKNDLVSIIVPVYNAEKFLADTIATVKNQTYNNWELIMVDDCSTDDSVKIITKYIKTDERIKLYKNSINSHAALTRNKGIDESKGRYIAFLDADDLWITTKLEKQIAFMQEKKCEFTFTGYEFADEKGKPNGKKVNVPSSLSYRQALKNTIIWTTTVMFDMQQLTKNQIYMPNVKSEDTACWWKVLKQIDRSYGMQATLSYYRRSNGTLSANKLEAVKRVWNLYRNVEKLTLFKSAYCFTGYAYNTVMKRI